MNFDWFVWSNPVTLWWVFLIAVSLVNIVAWIWTRTSMKQIYRDELAHDGNRIPKRVQWVVWCSAAYVFGCAFRSFIPRADVQRITLFDTWFASVFLGRTVATIAELAFVVQWAIVLWFLSEQGRSKVGTLISKTIIPLIVIAEICSWYAVITTNYIGNFIEESLWAFTYILVAVALIALFESFKGALKYAIGIAVVFALLYVNFMVTVDVPMYGARYIADLTSQKPFLGFIEGLIDLNTRWHVTHDIAEWKSEIPWMSLYFSFAVWVSIGLCYVPLSEKRLAIHQK